MPGRTIAIGDIHGCSAALKTLLDAISPTNDDTIITLGDYIDRGPDSHGVVEQLLAVDQQCELVPLMGNHEIMLLIAREQPEQLPWWRDCGGLATLLSYHENRPKVATDETSPAPASTLESTSIEPSRSDDLDSASGDDAPNPAASTPTIPGPEIIPQHHLDFFDSCALAYETDTHIFVHANYDAKTPMDQQDEEVLLWHHLTSPPGPHISGKKVVVGHTPQMNGEILDFGHLVCIDTFCFGNGWLTALDVETGKTWQANRNGEFRKAE